MVDSTNLPEVDINQIATDLNGKMDKDGVNASCPTLLSRTANSNGGVTEIWSDGYCVKTGRYNSSIGTDSSVTITLSQPFINTDYKIFQQTYGSTSGAEGTDICVKTNSKTTTNFVFCNEGYVATMSGLDWEAKGYIR